MLSSIRSNRSPILAQHNATAARPGLRYRERAPHAALASVVRCYWTSRGQGAADTPSISRVLPDGCMDLLFDLTPRADRSAVVVGTMLCAGVFSQSGLLDLLGVRFVPGAAARFLRERADVFTDHIVAAHDVWPGLPALTDALLHAHAEARFTLLDDYLLGRLRAGVPGIAVHGMAHIERARGQLSMLQLCRALNANERAVQRAFAHDVGLTPKQAMRIMRFRHAAELLRHRRTYTLAAIATTSGYADQAHLTREFHEFAAITPAGYRRERATVGIVQDEAGAAG